jgi:Galactose oxidase, central domain
MLAAANASLQGMSSSSIGTHNWSEVVSPAGRVEPALVYDPAGRFVLLFGGTLEENGVWVYLNDTWTYSAGVWTKLSLPVAPAPRTDAGSTYDPADGYVLLYGGNGPTAPPGGWLNDTWEFSNGTWSRVLTAKTPSLLVSPQLAYDATDGYVLMFAAGARVGITSTWSYSGGVWTDRTRSHEPAVYGFGLAADPADGCVVLFGGTNARGSFYSNQTWEYSAGNWTKVHVSSPVTPVWRVYPGLVYDSTLGEVALFGGTTNGPHGVIQLSGTWTFHAGSWSRASVSTSPSSRQVPTMVDDPAISGLLLIGGERFGSGGVPIILNDYWSFTFGNWSAIPAPGPAPRDDASLAFDPAIGDVVMFGGARGAVHFNDTWLFDGSSWVQTFPPHSPSARYGAAMSYDRTAGELLLFGGRGGSPFDDTWSYAHGTWTHLSTPTAPKGRYFSSMAYDPALNATILFGGVARSGVLSDTWMFQHGNWTRLALPTHPVARYLASMAYDPLTRALVLFGGWHTSPLADTWQFSGGRWHLIIPSISPTARYGAAMAYDPAVGRVILFGGYGSNSTNQTWTFHAGTWVRIYPGISPPASVAAGLCYDPSLGTLVLFGGGPTQPSADTWEY